MVKILSLTASIGPAVTEKVHWALKKPCNHHKYPELLKYFLTNDAYYANWLLLYTLQQTPYRPQWDDAPQSHFSENSYHSEIRIWYVHCIVWPMHLHFQDCVCYRSKPEKKGDSFKPENKHYYTVCLNEKSEIKSMKCIPSGTAGLWQKKQLMLWIIL